MSAPPRWRRKSGPLYQKAGGKSVDLTADDRANALIVLSSAGELRRHLAAGGFARYR